MKSAWRLVELRAAILERFPETSADVLQIVDSIDRSSLLFRYHAMTARDALKDFVDSQDAAGQKNVQLALGVSENQGEYFFAKLVQEAHLLGAIHAVRGMLDIFGQLANHLLLSGYIPVHLCTIHKVHAKLAPTNFKDALGSLLSSREFKYLSGFINTTKHRRLVQHAFTVSFEENRAEIKVGAFSFDGASFAQRWGVELLEDAHNLHNSLVACGRALNTQLGLATKA